jgi:hypothetical protein
VYHADHHTVDIFNNELKVARASHALLTRLSRAGRHARASHHSAARSTPALSLRAQHIVGDTACGAQEMVQHTTAGYNATVFAYAAASRAHTHTHARARARTRTQMRARAITHAQP